MIQYQHGLLVILVKLVTSNVVYKDNYAQESITEYITCFKTNIIALDLPVVFET